MKGKLFVVLSCFVITACASSSDVNMARSANSARVSQSELDQYNKQRSNEVTEAQAQAAKAEGYSSVIQSGSSAVQSAVGAIHSIKGLFGR